MIRDPLYRRIVSGLLAGVEHETFERCAVGLLGNGGVYANLAPVGGGSDGGFDGAFGTLDGPFPLITTTSRDVARNVQKNLQQYLRTRAGPKLAVVATSRPLNQTTRTKITNLAMSLGITIINYHDMDDFANRLYRHSAWRMELLNIPGDPPALSALPPRGRFDSSPLLVGRTAAFDRVRGHGGDLLIVGQPGSGKTYIHQHLAREGRCLFVATDNLGDIADGLRDEDPSCIVLDDAHTRLALLERLVRHRAEGGASFAIHANCWPGSEAACRAVLSLRDSDILDLEPLTRREILELIRACGIIGPDVLLHHLLEQSRGKPGLAVALVDACKRGEIHRVWTGETLADHLLAARQMARTPRELATLAAFAIGGDDGAPVVDVAESLGIHPLEVQQIITDLGSGGIVEVCDEHRRAVHPAPLRALLVRQVFFGTMKWLDPIQLIEASGSPEETAHVLMAARQQGATVPAALIESLVRNLDSADPWEHLSAIDDECADLILRSYPSRVCQAAPGLLERFPDRTLAVLLEHAAAGTIPEGTLHHPERRIGEWIDSDPRDPTSDSFGRRKKLFLAICRWAPSAPAGGGKTVGWALARILSPSYASVEAVPGSGREFRSIRGVYSLDQLRSIASLWPTVRDEFASLERSYWSPLLQQVENWCVPQRVCLGCNVAEQTQEFMRQTGISMLTDIVTLPNAGRAVRCWARDVVTNAQLPVVVEPDPEFDLLFGDRRRGEDWQAAQQKQEAGFAELARQLSAAEPEQSLSHLVSLEQEGHSLDVVRGGWNRVYLYRQLAKHVSSPHWWLVHLVAHDFNPEFVSPFVESLLHSNREKAVEMIGQLLESAHYASMSVRHALALDPPCGTVTSRALLALNGWNREHVSWLTWDPIPLATRCRLLTHTNPFVRASAAIAEWVRDPEQQIPESLQPEWRSAILAANNEDDHYLLQILQSDLSLAHDWIVARFENLEAGTLWRHRNMLVQLADCLTRKQRADLLSRFTVPTFEEDCFDALVGEDVSLFGEWLDAQGDAYLRTKPLRRTPNARWVSLAIVALDHGFTEDEVATCCHPYDGGLGSEDRKKVLSQFEGLVAHPDTRLHKAGHIGAEWARRLLDEAIRTEHEEEVYGFDAARKRRYRR